MVSAWGNRRRRRPLGASRYQASSYYPSGKTRRYSRSKNRPHSSAYARAHGWTYMNQQWYPSSMNIGGVTHVRAINAQGYFGPWQPALG